MTVRSKASLRIYGELDLEAITDEIGFSPSYSHRKGDVGQIKTVFETDMWSLAAPLARTERLDRHLEWLVDRLQNRYEVLERIKAHANVDVFCSVTAAEQDGFSLSPKAMSIFHHLQIEMEISLILGTELETAA